MNVGVNSWWCEEEMNRKGERVQRGQKRMWCSGGGGKIFVAGGKAGLTGQQQRLLVLPGFLLKTRTPPPHTPSHTHTSTHHALACPPSLHHHHSLLHFPLSPFCPVPSLTLNFFLLALFFFLHFSHFLIPPTTPSSFTSGPLQTLNSGVERRGGGGGGGGMGRWWRTKGPEMQRFDESGWFWKEAGRLLNAAGGRTDCGRQTERTPLLYPPPLAEACFAPPTPLTKKRAHHPPCTLCATPDVLSSTLRSDGGIAAEKRQEEKGHMAEGQTLMEKSFLLSIREKHKRVESKSVCVCVCLEGLISFIVRWDITY